MATTRLQKSNDKITCYLNIGDFVITQMDANLPKEYECILIGRIQRLKCLRYYFSRVSQTLVDFTIIA